jgi:hypothetical protein
MADEDSKLVLPVPEMDLGHVLRPWENFEDKYGGNPTYHPIYLCENNKPYDAEAAKGLPGIDPNLVSGLHLRMGTRTVLWFPPLWTEETNPHPYIWTVEWRIRNCYDHRNTPDEPIPFHFAKQGQGVPETNPWAHPGARVIIPAATETQIYVQDEPVAMPDRSFVHLRQVHIELGERLLQQPYMPTGELGVVQQGIFPSAPSGQHTRARFLTYEMDSQADEVLVSLWREQNGVDNWDFAGVDAQVSYYLGKGSGAQFSDLGVYAFYGVMP